MMLTYQLPEWAEVTLLLAGIVSVVFGSAVFVGISSRLASIGTVTPLTTVGIGVMFFSTPRLLSGGSVMSNASAASTFAALTVISVFALYVSRRIQRRLVLKDIAMILGAARVSYVHIRPPNVEFTNRRISQYISPDKLSDKEWARVWRDQQRGIDEEQRLRSNKSRRQWRGYKAAEESLQVHRQASVP